jgi:DNA-directed RNA polymerase subunit M/transcription elongation factor TFIIS
MFGKTVPNCVKNESKESCPECGGAMYPESMLNEKQDACYYKVKSRYKVWPSAYASGALVQCRKKGAANWGNKSESVKENFADGKNPQDKGDSARHGIPKGATMAELEKAAKAPGRKGQLARWQINMRRGKKK